MADIKNTTVRYLRELARKHLGKGHSRLKTKGELWEALKEAVPDALRGLVPAKAPGDGDASKGRKPRARAKGDLKARAAAALAPPPEAWTDVPEVQSRTSSESGQRVGLGAPKPGDPVEEGFFVARVVGEDEARRHGLTQGRAQRFAPEPYDEHLGELSSDYGSDDLVLMARDPKTLYVFWDVASQTREQAARGLVHPRAKLRIFDGGQMLREVDFALESRSFYLHGLPPGRRYRAEIHFVGEDGSSRRVGPSSNAVSLPPEGPSEDRAVRFLRVPWELPLSRLKEALRKGEAKLEQSNLPHRWLEWAWKRVPLPGSAGFRDEVTPTEHEARPPPGGPAPVVPRSVPTPSGMGLSSPHSPSGGGRS